MQEIPWSDWLDFSAEQISKSPESGGVFTMHASMKILHIGGSDNIRKSMESLYKKECTCEAKRFKYALVEDYEQAAAKLLAEYQEKHAGTLPKCM